MSSKELIRMVLVVKGKEPEVVEVGHDLKDYEDVLRNNLSEVEKSKSDVYGLDFFSPNVDGISGMVEEYSACHPYERNRDWHGPALFFEFDDRGKTISISDEKVEELKSVYALANRARSTSEKINNFLDTYHKEPVVFNFSYGNMESISNTMDFADIILAERRDTAIKEIESVFDGIKEASNISGKSIEDHLTNYLIGLGKMVLRNQVEANPMLSM